MSGWQTFKVWAGEASGLSDATLHVLAGMVLLLVAAGAVRRVPWDWRPWAILLALEIGNEVYDMLTPASGEAELGASFHDLWLTMLCPTLLMLFVPALIRRSERRAASSADRFEQPFE